MTSLAWIKEELAALERDGLLRELRARGGPQAATVGIDGARLLNFGSNDYLSLAADPRLAAAAAEAIAAEGWGSGASPLLAGRSAAHQRLEQRLAEFESAESAVLFASGYAANAGTIAALAGPGDAVFCDELNHASLWDGCRLSRADVRPYPHNDCRRLAQLLEKSRQAKHRRRLIVSDGLFSMDGDLAPLGELADLADRFDAMLLIDEAHATGVFGAHGRGTCEHLGVEGRTAARVGTLSKALGGSGGFVAGDRALADWLINRARSYVFSTAAPAAMAAAACAALDIVRDEQIRRESLLRRAESLRTELRAAGWDTGPSASQIIPLMVGDSRRAVELSRRLWQRGIFVPAIRPPTVPRGQARLRVSLAAGHTDEMLAMLARELHAARKSA
jgi:8-amino-7-oxononanoate synthase